MRAVLLLVASVVAAVLVGVGIEAATQPTRYGPPGGQFTAAFPSTPTVHAPKARAGVVPTYTYAAGGPSHRLTVAVTAAGSGWTGYAPTSAAYRSSVAFTVSKRRRRGFPRHLKIRPASIHGQTVELGIACGRTSCFGILFGLARRVDGHLVEWSATAVARSSSSARTLLSSVRPVAGAIPSPAGS